MPDITRFEFLQPPFEATFWRLNKDSRVVHDCPILESPNITGLSYDDWVVDILHSWVQGGVSSVVGTTLTFCVKSGVFSPASIHLDSDDRDRLAMLHIKALCSMCYKEKRDTDPHWKMTGTEVRAGVDWIFGW